MVPHEASWSLGLDRGSLVVAVPVGRDRPWGQREVGVTQGQSEAEGSVRRPEPAVVEEIRPGMWILALEGRRRSDLWDWSDRPDSASNRANVVGHHGLALHSVVSPPVEAVRPVEHLDSPHLERR